MLDKLHTIQYSECKDITKYISWINNAIAKIKDLKITISEAAIIHAFNNFDLHFQFYLAILSHNAWEKKKLLTLSDITKTLEDKQLRHSNKNRKTANYIHSSKLKKAKLNEQREKAETEKGVNNKKDKKRQELKEYKIYRSKHLGNYWHLKTKYYICHNVGHITANCPERPSNH